jgi:UDP-glucose 4-epimerase
MSYRVVVTGGSGRIGSVLCARLAAAGHGVVVVDRNPPPEQHGEWVYADLCDRTALQPVFRNADAVVHLGELPGIRSGTTGQDVFLRNVRIATTILEMVSDLRTPRFVYTSSCQVYGMWGGAYDPRRVRPQQLPMDETQPLFPRTGYAMAKAVAEQYAAMLAHQKGLGGVIFRLPVTVNDEWLEWFARDTRKLERSVGEVDGLWTWLHVDDAADAFVAALEREWSGLETIHLSAPDVLGDRPLAERLTPLPVGWPALPPDAGTRSLLDCSKARRLLGWTPARRFGR